MASPKAVRIHSYGGTEVLSYEDAPRPGVANGEILIRIHATTVNPFDCAARAGYVSAYYPYTFPLILGLDVSGVVEEVGAEVKGFAVGDAVYARADPARNGAYADYIAVSAVDAAAKPKSLGHIEAAALPQAALTAWRALVDAANLTSGQTVLIHGAAGGVGSLAVQLAKVRGAKVIGTASANNLDFLRELGVDQAIDYTAQRFEDAAHDVDVVLDTVGGDTLERSWAVLKRGGILTSVVQPPDEAKAAQYGVRQQFVGAFPPAGGVLAEIAKLVDAGKIKPVVSSIMPLQDIQQAHTMSQGRHTRGKIVLKVVN
jgi:NADPH:quinone reductase-like Zn-dependent oxidoreductase